MGMMEARYTVRFVTPAFLGDADQRGRWRTPPFKALLRQWWRVVAAKECNYEWQEVRRREGELFGHAWLEEGGAQKKWAGRSLVHIRLDHWSSGVLSNLKPSGSVCHPEVDNPKMQPCPNNPKGRLVESNLYLGFGVVGTKGLDRSPAIGTAEVNSLTIIFPDTIEKEIQAAITLINAFGTLGARSRNGWGSVTMTGNGHHPPGIRPYTPLFLNSFKSDLAECLSSQNPWPHAIGADEKGLLIWLTDPKDEIAQVFRLLAKVKIEYRTKTPLAGVGGLGKRHLLGYPVTNHPVAAWGKKARLANQIRFKVIQEHDRKYRGVVYHMPCGLPKELGVLLKRDQMMFVRDHQLAVWQHVHRVLDSYEGKGLTRVKGGV